MHYLYESRNYLKQVLFQSLLGMFPRPVDPILQLSAPPGLNSKWELIA